MNFYAVTYNLNEKNPTSATGFNSEKEALYFANNIDETTALMNEKFNTGVLTKSVVVDLAEFNKIMEASTEKVRHMEFDRYLFVYPR